MKPLIGITAWRRPLPTYLGEQTDLYTLAAEYVESVARAGAEVVILPHGTDAGRVLDALDGLLLSGGDDVHPESYQDRHTGVSEGVNLEADRWEMALVREAARRHMPVLAICRGMQILSVAMGGRLLQHLEDVEGHPDFHDLTANEILSLRHEVQLEPACELARVYGETVREVNTIHHQAVVDPGALAVVGRGTGNVIEAVEAGNRWPAVGIQWHPEKMHGDAFEERLFQAFVAEAASFATSAREQAVRA